MYMGNLSLRTVFNLFFFIRKFSNFRICSNLVGFNRINSIEFLLNVQNQLMISQCCTFYKLKLTRFHDLVEVTLLLLEYTDT